MYEQRVILFLDILGFKDLIDKDGGERIAGILKRLDGYRKLLATPNSSLGMTTFSDCIVVSIKGGSGANVEMVMLFGFILWLDLLRHGVLARGAITVGELFHEDNIVFGPAMVEAYLMESKNAIYPRILVSSSCKKLLDEPHAPFEFCTLPPVRRDFDGYWHLDVFHSFAPGPPGVPIPEGFYDAENKLAVSRQVSLDWRALWMGHRIVALCDLGFSGKASPKYYWLWNYYTSSCERHGFPFPWCPFPRPDAVL